jgi:ABC-type multidrug transport system fused ATPase/permease subunit
MLLAADYPFLDVLWTMIIFFAWVTYIWIAITVLIDVFRRHDIGGFAKALWVIFVIVLPFLGVLIYLIVEDEGMRQRTFEHSRAQRAQLDQYLRETAGGSASEIAKAKELLDAGTITQAEFDAIKQRALAQA